MQLHTWIKQALNMDNPQEAKEFIEDWIENQDIDFSHRMPMATTDFEYQERPYEPSQIEPVIAMPKSVIKELYSGFDTSIDTLKRLVWCKEDLIEPELLKEFDVAYCPVSGSIILPHHNINGDIVGLYERSFRPLRKDVKKLHPEIDYKLLLKYPRAKYVPLLRAEQYQTEEKTSWSFPNSMNLYGLHKAKDAIAKDKIAIVFEGGKSVMLARQYGYPMGVATHTFGVHLNHISMLIECGAKEIVLAFDKQYEQEEGQAWELYERKTQDIARKVGTHCKISRVIDRDGATGFKDSPIDRGRDVFIRLFGARETLGTQRSESRHAANDKTISGQTTNSRSNILILNEEEQAKRKRLKEEGEKYNKYFIL